MRDRLVILAAGGGTRLRQAKLGSTKPMTEVGGAPMIVRVLVGARRIGVTRADIVIGYRGDEIKEALSNQWKVDGITLRFIENPVWESTANGVSLLAASDDQSPFYLSMADHLFDDAMWDAARAAQTPEDGVTLLTDRKIAECFDIDDATKVQVEGQNIVAISKELKDYNALDCGLFAVTKGIFAELSAERAIRGDCSLSDGMRRLGTKGKFWSHDVGKAFWHDVDTPEAFAFAEKYLATQPPFSLSVKPNEPSFWEIEERVKDKVKVYCHNKGFEEVEGVNNFVPHDCIKAFQMAKFLTQKGFDIYLSIAPEGFIYSYFFEQFGAKVISVLADYPPTFVKPIDDLSQIQGKRVLVIEDDVIGGGTLRLLAKELSVHSPKELSVYLGHNKNIQRLHNVPTEYAKSYVAEDTLDRQKWLQYEKEFIEFFK